MTNAAAAIAQEVKEGHNTGGHVGAGIVAGVLTTAEANDVAGDIFIDACTSIQDMYAIRAGNLRYEGSNK